MCPPSTVVLQSAASCHYRWPHSRLHLFKQRAYREMVLCPTTHVILLKASSERRCRVEQYLSKVCCPMRSSSPSGACCTLSFMYPNKKVICMLLQSSLMARQKGRPSCHRLHLCRLSKWGVWRDQTQTWFPPHAHTITSLCRFGSTWSIRINVVDSDQPLLKTFEVDSDRLGRLGSNTLETY